MSATRAMLLAVTLVSFPAWAVKTGDQAPDFKAKDATGAEQSLSAQKGKYVVLEWHNQGCPFVRKHYESRNMQKIQRQAAGKDLAWFTVISSKPGKQGHQNAKDAMAYVKKMEASPTAVLLDEKGEVGSAYGARTTPHMFVIDPKGKLIYQGAIDDKSSTDPATIPGAKNYVLAALAEARAGKTVTDSTTEPYGCSVKY